jgi:hypothetical protein
MLLQKKQMRPNEQGIKKRKEKAKKDKWEKNKAELCFSSLCPA